MNTPSEAPFDPTHEYGLIDWADVPVEVFETSARHYLPKGTPFKVLQCARRNERAWYYSPDYRNVPNLNTGVMVLKECIA